jgi:lycopene cyclase domain-containing protein
MVYIAWDIWFTRMGIWGFNHNFTLDAYLAGLPLEEWLFFLVIPYSCIFIFEVLRYFVRRFYYPVLSRWVIISLLVLFAGGIPLVHDRLYSLCALSFTSLMLVLQLVQRTWKTWFSGFMVMYLLALVPFIIVNGLLTSVPVVWYNNAENLGLRVWTVPADDFVYLMGLLLPAMNIYQWLLRRYAPVSLAGEPGPDGETGF